MPQTADRPLKVLIADDEPEVRDLLAEHFREIGYDVTTAADGSQAVAEIAAHPAYRLVISDLQMPGVDGLGVLEAAKTANPSTQVVIVTGHASVDSAVRAVRMGAYDYLTKPFTLGQIEDIVRRATERQTPDSSVAARLDAIEQQLARLERLLMERPATASRH